MEVVCTHIEKHFDDIMPKEKREREMTIVENVVEKLIVIMKSPKRQGDGWILASIDH